jgi:hypothetical protein
MMFLVKMAKLFVWRTITEMFPFPKSPIAWRLRELDMEATLAPLNKGSSYNTLGTRWRLCLRQYASSRKDAGIFNLHNQLLTEIFPGNKDGRWLRLTTLPFCVSCHEIWEPQSPGTLRACPDLYRDCFALTYNVRVWQCIFENNANLMVLCGM